MSQQRGIYDVFGNPVYNTQPASTNALASAIGYFMGRNMGEHALKRQQNKVDEWLDQNDPNSDYNFMQQVAKNQQAQDAQNVNPVLRNANASNTQAGSTAGNISPQQVNYILHGTTDGSINGNTGLKAFGNSGAGAVGGMERNGVSPEEADYILNGKQQGLTPGQMDYILKGTSPDKLVPSFPNVKEQVAHNEYKNYADAALDAIERNMNMSPFEQGKQKLNPKKADEFERWARNHGVVDSVIEKNRKRIDDDQRRFADSLYQSQINRLVYGYETTDENGKKVFHAPTDSDRVRAVELANEYAQYNPEQARVYGATVAKGFETRAAQDFQREMQQRQFDQQAKMQQNQFAQQASMRAGRGGAGGLLGNRELHGIYQAMNTIFDKYAIKDDLGNPTGRYYDMSQWLPADRAEYNRLNAMYQRGQGIEPQQPKKPSEIVDEMYKEIDLGEWDGNNLGEGKKYNFVDGTQRVIDYMRSKGANNQQIFDAFNKTLTADGAPQEYIDALGSSLGVKTAGASQANESQLSPAEQRKQQQEEKMNNIRGFRQEMQAAGLLTRNGNPNYNVSPEGTQLIQEAMERWGLTKDDL